MQHCKIKLATPLNTKWANPYLFYQHTWENPIKMKRFKQMREGMRNVALSITLMNRLNNDNYLLTIKKTDDDDDDDDDDDFMI